MKKGLILFVDPVRNVTFLRDSHYSICFTVL